MIKGDMQRTLGNTEIVAVTKGQSVERINKEIEAGIKIIGENYVQEAAKKVPALLPVEKHLIGHLQTNKIKKALQLFDCIQSVDSEKLWGKISDKSDKERNIPIFLQVNGGNEETKSGFLQEEILSVVKTWQAHPSTILRGIMVVAPEQEAEKNRPLFRVIKKGFEHAQKTCPTLHHLSMGTSHDYMIALEEGTTMVRLGTALFGSRYVYPL